MRGNEFLINYGGEWLDVDSQSVGGFDFTTLWKLDSRRIVEKGRTLDLSVPATKTNTRIFNDHKLLPGEGVRRGINGMVVAGGVNITGVIYVSEYNSGRYSLMMAYGQSFAGFGNYNHWSVFNDTLSFNGKDVPTTNGTIPDFGWYEYGNEYSPHSIVGEPPKMHPCTNLKHVIDRIATALGYTVSYPSAALGRGYQADAYGLVLPSFGVQAFTGSAAITGSALGGWSYTLTGVGTLDELGFEIVDKTYWRGFVRQDVDVKVFRAVRPVHISIPDNSNVVICTATGYKLYNDWQGLHGCEVDMKVGDYFTFVSPNEWHTVAGQNYWNKTKTPPAYEGNVSVTLTVNRSVEVPVAGDTLYLANALPQQPLEWWLDAYCNIIFGAWTVDKDTKTITVKTYGERLGDALADASRHITLEDEKMISIDNVKRYIDGFAQHNHTKCDGKHEGLPSVYPYDRDLQQYNDYLEQERDMAAIPFNDGGIQGGANDSRYYLYINDVTDDGNGGYNYDGVLTIFMENTDNTDGAVHLTEALNMGVGMDMESVNMVSANADTPPVSYEPDYQAYSVVDLNSALTDTTSTTYASLHLTRGTEAETWITYNFGLNIPPGATINSVTAKARSFVNTTQSTRIKTRTVQLYSGATAKGSPTNLNNSWTTQTLTPGTWTAAELNQAKIKWYVQRNTSNVNTDYYMNISGAEIHVSYDYNDSTHYAVSAAFSASVRLRLPLFRFARIGGGTCASLHGRNFVISNAKWSGGVAQLDMVCFPPIIPEKTMFLRVLSVTNVTCFDGADGGFTVEAVGGTAPYTYSLNADFSNSNNTGVFSGLSVTAPVEEGTDQYGGTVYCYKTVYVKDADNNTAVGAVRLQSPCEFEWLGEFEHTFECPPGETSVHMVPGVDFDEPYLSTTANNAETLNPMGYPVGYIFQKGQTYTGIRYDAANDCGDYIQAYVTITVI